MKYIMYQVVRSKGTPEEIVQTFPFVFAEAIVHADADEHFRHLLRRTCEVSRAVEISAVSAGFFEVDRATCHGRSESMNLASRPDDSTVMRMHGYGINHRED